MDLSSHTFDIVTKLQVANQNYPELLDFQNQIQLTPKVVPNFPYGIAYFYFKVG